MPKTFKPRLYSLEGRELPAATLTATFAEGVLRIEGTEAADDIRVRQLDSRVSVPGVRILLSATHEEVADLPADRVDRVEVIALGGNDAVHLGGDSKFDPPLGVSGSIDGGAGDDTLVGGSGNDTVRGQDGNDVLSGRSGDDTVDGGAGKDGLREAGNVDFLLTNFGMTGLGTDVVAGLERAELTGGVGDNTLEATLFSGPVTLTGGAGNDLLLGGGSSDALLGGAGDDRLRFGAGKDGFDGGDGTDTIEATADVDWTLTPTTLTGAGTHTLLGIERAALGGGAGNNRIDTSGFGGPVVVFGFAGDDTLTGGVANDSLNGGDGEDLLVGNGGNDTLVGGEGFDIAQGLDGDDQLFGQGGFDLLAGGDGNDTLDGGADGDSLYGEGDSDSLLGQDGGDYLAGDLMAYPDGDADVPGTDTMRGGTGTDTVDGGAGDDALFGDDGDDFLMGAEGTDALDGGAGADRVEASGDVDFTLTKTSLTGQGTDALVSIEGARLTGLAGNNKIDAFAFDGPVTLNGSGGADTLIGGEAGDSLVGGDGNDQLIGNAGPDTLSGGSGADSLRGSDILGNEDAGNQLDGGAGDDTLRGGTGNDTLIGGDNDDSLFGSTGNDTLQGSAGNDILDGFEGNDALDGGLGTDRLVATADANLLLTTFSLTGQGNDSVAGIEQAVLTGGGGNNVLEAFGFTGPVTIFGGGGKDTLTGGMGSDSLDGGSGDDFLSGGPGGDAIVGGDGTDRVGVSTDTNGSIFLSGNSAITITSTSTVVDSLSSIQGAVLSGSGGNNLLDASGFSGAVLMNGHDGDDTLIGGSANDTMHGGFGADVLNGGPGVNSYVPNPTPFNAHRALYLQFDGADIKYDIPNHLPDGQNDLVGWAGSQWEDPDHLDEDHDGLTVAAFRPNEAGREALIKNIMQLVGEDYRTFGVDVVRRNAGELAVAGVGASTVFVGEADLDNSGNPYGRSSDVDLGNDNQTDIAVVRREVGDTNAEVTQFVANVIAHEAGHTFGLQHKENVFNGQALNELMVQGSAAFVELFQTTNFAFLDQTFNLVHDPGSENSYTTLMENMGLPVTSEGPPGTPLPPVPADLVDSDGELDFGPGPLGGGCGCAICGGAVAAAKADPAGRAEPAEFLHRLRPAEFVTLGRMTPGTVVRPGDLNRTGEGTYRVVRTLRGPDGPRQLAGVVLRPVSGPEAPAASAAAVSPNDGAPDRIDAVV